MEREVVTVSIPADSIEQAKQFLESNETFNEMVVEAIAHEVRRRRSLAAHQRIVARKSGSRSQNRYAIEICGLDWRVAIGKA